MNSALKPLNQTQRANRQQGLGLISALFVITVLALLAAGMASLNVSSAQTHSQQIVNIRANSAANSALEIYQTQFAKQNSCSAQAIDYQFNSRGLYECKALVSCTNTNHQGEQLITVQVDASCGQGFDSASASITQRLIKYGN